MEKVFQETMGRLAAISKPLLFSVCLAFIGLSCLRPVFDSLIVLRFTGDVETNDGVGLENAEIYFVDTGLDHRRQHLRKELLVGRSAEDGSVDTRFEYLWARSGRSRLGNGTFEVIARHGMAFSEPQRFILTKLDREDGTYLVPLRLVLVVNSTEETSARPGD